ncbi:MAG TPA: hypothetical protein VF533_08200, partial [Solirubrobacteraceae bacterium]
AGDRYDGGPGDDHLDYDRITPVAVDLRGPAPGGAPGEGDRHAGIEDVRGGLTGDRLSGGRRGDRLSGEGGDDVLRGRDGRDGLDGGAGDDVIDAGPGRDFVTGGAGDDAVRLGAGDDYLEAADGADRVDAGPGDDVLSVPDAGFAVRLRCGPGRDRVADVTYDQPLRVPRDCERVDAGDGRILLRSETDRPATVRYACEEGPGETCRVRLELRRVRRGDPGEVLSGRFRRDPLIGLGRAKLHPGQRVRALAARLSARGRRLLRRRGRVQVRVLLRVRRGRDDGNRFGAASVDGFLVELRDGR